METKKITERKFINYPCPINQTKERCETCIPVRDCYEAHKRSEGNYLSQLDKALGNLQMSLQALETNIGEVRAMMRENGQIQ